MRPGQSGHRDRQQPAPEPAGGEDTVRILIPDHPELAGVVSGAVEFAGVLRHANTPPADDGDAEPWRLPDQLTAPELEQVLDTIFHPWGYAVGDDGRDTGIPLRHAGIEHMPVYVAAATRTQLARLAAAATVFTQAEVTPAAQRTPLLAEVAEFAALAREVEDPDDGWASLRSWQTILALLEVATATAPESTRPRRLLAPPAGDLQSLPDAAGTSPAADTVAVLAAIDTAGGTGVVDLDGEAFAALRRLQAEWHAVIYRGRHRPADSLLTSYTY